MPRQEPVGQHNHEFFEIVVVLSGSAMHVTGNYRHRIESGDIFVINPRRSHGYEDCQSLNIANVIIRDDVLARIGRALGDQPAYHTLFRLESNHWRQQEYSSRLRLAASELQRVEEWVTRLEEEARRGARAVHLVEEACLALIVDLLCRRYEKQYRPTRRRPEPTPTHRLGHLLSWIEQNLERPLKVDHLAEQAGMSPRTFYRAFQSALKMTPQAYLARARIQRAAEMLSDAHTSHRVTEVALACGFGDGNYFTRCFHKATGQTPSEFRRQRLLAAAN